MRFVRVLLLLINFQNFLQIFTDLVADRRWLRFCRKSSLKLINEDTLSQIAVYKLFLKIFVLKMLKHTGKIVNY